MTIIGTSGINYQLDTEPLNSGGEGEIYRIINGTEKSLVKIYHQNSISPELEAKLKYMVKNTPGSTVLSQVAWPLDVVYDTTGSFCGFVMSELDVNSELSEIYKYPPVINLSSQNKITIAKNICAVISEVHKAGYVFGDFNPRNIGVDKNTGLVGFFDTDSYHVADRETKKVYRCNVCAAGYSAPELLERCADHVSKKPSDSGYQYAKTPLPTFTKETDSFALAIHIFKLLNNGYTPFGGISEKSSRSQTSPGTGDTAVRRDNYCFKPGNKPQSPAVSPLNIFPQELAALFTRAFIIGKKDPRQRPSSLEWYSALTDYEQSLLICPKNSLHQYHQKNSTCPWCECDKQYQISVSPIIQQHKYTNTATPVKSPISSTNIRPPKNTPIGSTYTPMIIIIAGVILMILFYSIWQNHKANDLSTYDDYQPVSEPNNSFEYTSLEFNIQWLYDMIKYLGQGTRDIPDIYILEDKSIYSRALSSDVSEEISVSANVINIIAWREVIETRSRRYSEFDRIVALLNNNIGKTAFESRDFCSWVWRNKTIVAGVNDNKNKIVVLGYDASLDNFSQDEWAELRKGLYSSIGKKE